MARFAAFRSRVWAWPMLGLCFGLLVLPGAAATAQTSTGAPGLRDEFQRRGMSYFDTFVHPRTAEIVGQERIDSITRAVRSQVEGMGRFERIVPMNVRAESPQEFVRALQGFLQANQEAIAMARQQDLGEGYSFEYRETIVTAEAMMQVLNSAYAYQVTVGAPTFREEVEPYEVQAPRIRVQTPLDPAFVQEQIIPNLQGTGLSLRTGAQPALVYTDRVPMPNQVRARLTQMFPGNDHWAEAIATLQQASNDAPHVPVPVIYQGRFLMAELPIRVEFFRIAIVNENWELVPADRAIVPVTGGSRTVVAEGRQERYLISPGSDEYLDIVAVEGEASARQRVAQSRAHGERSSADTAAAAGPSATAGLETWVRGIPEFQVRTQVVEVYNNTVSMLPGRSEDILLDDWFRLYQEGESGRRIDLGWTRVRHVGPGFSAVGDGATAAREDRSRLEIYRGDPEIGYMLGEYATYGIQFDLRLGYDFSTGHSGHEASDFGSVGGSIALSLFLGANLARYVNISEFYAGIEFGLGLGDEMFIWNLGLQFRKKLFLARGAWLLDVGGSIGILQIIDSSEAADTFLRDEVDALGGELISPIFAYIEPRARIVYFISPQVELFADLTLRLGFGSTDDVGVIPGINSTEPDFSWRPIGFMLAIGVSLSA